MRSLFEFAIFLFEDVEIVLPFSIFYRALDSCEPFVEYFLLIEADMNSPRLLVRVVIDGLEHKAVVLLIFGEPEQVILEVVGSNPCLLFSEEHMSLRVESKYLLLPSLYVETARVASVVDEVTALDDRWLEGVFDEIADITHYPYVVLHLLLSTQRPEGFDQLLRERFLLRFLLGALLIREVELLSYRVFAEL